MSTKNLARTVIEGGRSHYNCWERRHSHSEARAAERVTVQLARAGHDADDLVWPEAKPVRRSFHDKLSAAEQWLLSNAGRPWDRVRSEIFARFDVRTLAGQHIVFDHLLSRRRDRDDTWRVDGHVRFRVDRHGILRAEVRPRRWVPTRPVTWAPDLCDAVRFANGRRVVARGAHLYWCVCVVAFEPGAASRFRQERALGARERERFENFSELARGAITLALD